MTALSEKRVKNILKAIKTYSEELKSKTHEELIADYRRITWEVDDGIKPIEKALPFIYALVKEAFYRIQGIVVYEGQLLGAISMYFGCAAEIATGEGKTVSAVFVAILSSLSGKVHVVTVNDYLAERDFKKMSAIYEFFDISCCANINKFGKQQNYSPQIIYTSSSKVIFDYLTEEIKGRRDEDYSNRVRLDTAIIDEIDFILLDNAITSFTVSEGKAEGFKEVALYKAMKQIIGSFVGGEINNRLSYALATDYLQDYDFIYSKGNAYVELTEGGLKKLEKIFGLGILNTNPAIYRAAIYTIEAEVFYKRGISYIIQGKGLCLINEANGRIMHNSHKETGLQQAIEIKEGLEVTGETNIAHSMTYQMFFNMYKRLTGMSGTLQGTDKEFADIYNLRIFKVPLNKKLNRSDAPYIVFKTKADKYQKLLAEINMYHNNRQPILIVTESELEVQSLAEVLKGYGYFPQILVNDNGQEEAEIIRGAGSHGTITISTNMVGRGTDIILDEISEAMGGLVVIIVNGFKSTRVDWQVRGRTGRQGQRGISLSFSSLEDKIWTNLEAICFEGLREMDEKLFYSSRMQKKLRNTLSQLQKQQNHDEWRSRKENYSYDKALYYMKEYIYSYPSLFIGDIKTKAVDFIKAEFSCYCRINENIRITFMNRPHDEKFNEEELLMRIIDAFIIKYNTLGPIADALFRELIKQQILKEIGCVAIELLNLKNDMSASCRGHKSSLIDFQIKSKEIVDQFLTFVTMRALEDFMTAELKIN